MDYMPKRIDDPFSFGYVGKKLEDKKIVKAKSGTYFEEYLSNNLGVTYQPWMDNSVVNSYEDSPKETTKSTDPFAPSTTYQKDAINFTEIDIPIETISNSNKDKTTSNSNKDKTTSNGNKNKTTSNGNKNKTTSNGNKNKTTSKSSDEFLGGYALGRGLDSTDEKVINSKKSTILSIASFIKNKLGLPKNVIVSILGNMYAESGIDFSIEEKGDVAMRGYGLLQFTGDRRNELEKFAKERGKYAYDPITQLEYLASELLGHSVWTNGGSMKGLNNLGITNKPINEINVYLLKTFIRPSASKANLQLRIDASNYINNLLE